MNTCSIQQFNTVTLVQQCGQGWQGIIFIQEVDDNAMALVLPYLVIMFRTCDL